MSENENFQPGQSSTIAQLRHDLGRIGYPLAWEERRAIENALLDVAEAAQRYRTAHKALDAAVKAKDVDAVPDIAREYDNSIVALDETIGKLPQNRV